ncbi:hypothetical protein [Natrinema sp. HArc-T2]|uniref:DUF7287 family protein n=1 Tax=Natrinema sp. HArc-T2 TaxID=3242701 RepID=UPI00359DCF4F
MTWKRPNERRRCQTKRQRSDTVSSGSTDRGQTTQDFAVGIGIFLLAIAFVFSFLPTIMMPFDSSISGAETAQADRIASHMINNTSTETANNISADEFNKTYTKDDLTAELGLRQTDNVNVTVVRLENGTILTPSDEWSGGDIYDNQSAASSARIITTDHGSCDPACRLIVRVW